MIQSLSSCFTITIPNKTRQPTAATTPFNFPCFHNISTTPFNCLSIRRHCLADKPPQLLHYPQEPTRQLPAQTTTDALLVEEGDENDDDFQDFFQLSLMELEDDDVVVNHRVVSHPYPGDKWSWLMGSCNGLVCYISDDFKSTDSIYVCNPSTGEYVQLPPTNKYSDDDHNKFGFGFDPHTKQYKFIRMFNYKSQFLATMCTLGGPSPPQWTTLYPPPYRPHGLEQHAFVNGALHWPVHRRGLIMAFHLSREEFYFIPLSLQVTSAWNGGSFMILQEFGGYLSFMQRKHGQVEIWIMKEYGVPDSWTKQFVISNCINGSRCGLEPIKWMKNGNILVRFSHPLHSGGNSLACYDPITKTFHNHMQISKIPLKGVTPYARSSVSLKAIVGPTYGLYRAGYSQS